MPDAFAVNAAWKGALPPLPLARAPSAQLQEHVDARHWTKVEGVLSIQRVFATHCASAHGGWALRFSAGASLTSQICGKVTTLASRGPGRVRASRKLARFYVPA